MLMSPTGLKEILNSTWQRDIYLHGSFMYFEYITLISVLNMSGEMTSVAPLHVFECELNQFF